MRWWQALTSTRGELWIHAVLFLCAVVLAIGSFVDDNRPVYGWLWVLVAVANASMAVSRWRALRAGPGEVTTTP